MSIAKRYLQETEAREFTAPSGYVFVVRGMTKIDFARILGGLPVVSSKLSEEQAREAERVKNEALERQIYEEFVDGVLDPETNVPEMIPYDKVLVGDMDPLITFAMKRGGLGSQKADDIRRALR